MDAAAKALELIRDEHLDAFVVAGDLKDSYNPWDGRIVNFWRTLIRQVRDAGAIPILLMGNHDRTSLTHDQFTWMPVLADAGAVTCESQGVFDVDDGKIYALAFSPDADTFARRVKILDTYPADPKTDILVFHETLIGASWNRQADVGDGEASVSLAGMDPERYRYVIGGDIHMHQQLGPNAWYVGSPFPHTWGECNQRKVFALIRDDSPIRFVATDAPGWYDPAVAGFQAPKTWEGARVRIRVQTSAGSDYGKAVLEARAEAEKRYPGATAAIQPAREIADGAHAPDAPDERSEDARIRQYVESAAREADVDAAVAYILGVAGGSRERSGGIRFRSVKARNFLCFGELDMQLDVPGITVVTGINRDRPGKSNGSGKTSLLSALPVALFGKTFKGQKADAWARRGTTSASVSAEFETADGQIMRAERSRGPSTTRLFAGDAEVSAGGRQDDVGVDIEEFCGFSWDMFKSTVFLSQEEIGAFLWGAPKDRYEAIARMQGLERFDDAWSATGKRVRREERNLTAAEDDVRETRDRLAAIKDISNVGKELSEARNAQLAASNARNDAADAVPDEPDAEPRRKAREKWRKKTFKAEKERTYAAGVRRRIKDMESAPDKCSECGRPFERDQDEIDAALADLRGDMRLAEEAVQKAAKAEEKAESAYDLIDEAYNAAAADRKAKKAVVAAADRRLDEAKEAVRKWERKAAEERGEVAELKELLKIREAAVIDIAASLEFARTMHRILARDGLPAYLCQTLCPRLNAAADHFSDLFTDGEIRVRFSVEDGKAMVDVINPHGGETVRDQSTGEGRVAALIACFALRETSDLANILILDEPGSGLDHESYRAFANGLKSMADSGSIYVITHDAGLASELSGARHIRVEKQDGVSRLVTDASVK